MNNLNIPKKILYWYDNNKRELPWRRKVSKKEKEYFTFVSEFMLQQTQVKTVIPYFEKFIKLIPNFQTLANIDDQLLMKQWEGLGYYSRAKNLKKSAVKIINDFRGRLPKSYDNLIQLPGVGEYTSKAIMSIAFNIKTIPLDGNVERVLKRTLYLKNQSEITKEFLKTKINFFGQSDRASDYSQAIMEIGALICKPKKPNCHECPLKKSCLSFEKNDFELVKFNKKIKTKYFEATIYKKQNNYLLVKNDKFKFLKNMPIFPMTEVQESMYKYSTSKKINIKLSNMEMKILLNNSNKIPKIKNKILIKKNKLSSKIIPSFTKKIFNTISKFE